MGDDHPDTLLLLGEQALHRKQEGEFAEAEALGRQVLSARLQFLGPGHQSVTTTRNNLAMLYRSMGRYDEALPLLEESLRASTEALGPDHPVTLRTRYYLGFLFRKLGRIDEAQAEYELALSGQEARLGIRHSDTLMTLSNLAYLYRLRRRYDDSERLYLQSLTALREVYGENHEDVIQELESLGSLYLDMGDAGRALPYFEETVQRRTIAIGEDAILTQSAAIRVWRALDRLGRHEEALRVASRAAELLRGSDNKVRRALFGTALIDEGISLQALGRHELAQESLLAARAIYFEDAGETSRDVEFVDQRLRALYLSWGRPDDAARYPAKRTAE